MFMFQSIPLMKPKPPPRLPIYTRSFWETVLSHITENALHSAIQILGLIVLYIVLRYVLFKLINGLVKVQNDREIRNGTTDDRSGRLQTMQGLFKNLIGYLLTFIFGSLFFQAIGFNIIPFITTAGVIGVVLGFGAQKLVKDIISGFLIITDNIYLVGDVVTIGLVTGQVQEMGMRVTRLLDTTGREHYVANGDVSTVTNHSRHPLEDSIEISVGAAADVNRVKEIIEHTAETLMTQSEVNLLQATPKFMGISAFSPTTINVRVKIVTDLHSMPVEQMRVREAIRLALIKEKIALA